MIKNKFTIKNGIAEVEVIYKGSIRICYINEEVLSWPEFAKGTISYQGRYPVIWINGKANKVHRIVAKHLGLELKKLDVDHKDQNPFNATFENLRNLTRSQNLQNSKARGKIGYKGVTRTRAGHFIAWITVAGKSVNLGYYNTDIEAARAYDIAAKKQFGESAYTNGIDESIIPTRLTRSDRRKNVTVNE